jgi:hypothetical protein
LRTFGDLDVHTIAYGLRCVTTWTSCPNGVTLHEAWAIVRSATVTLEDLEAPVVGDIEASGLADGQWHRGPGSLTFSASDNTGVRVRWVVEGAQARVSQAAPGASAGGCGEPGLGEAYTYLKPCDGDRGLNGRRAIAVADVCAWGDGVHYVKAAATDTGGGEATSAGTATVRVDCTAPAVAISPASDQEVPAGTKIAPAVSASDARVGVASTEVQVQVGTQAWGPHTGAIPAQAGSWYRFRARATDSIGNVSAWSVSAWTTGVRVETPPPTSQTPQEPSPDETETPPAPLLPTQAAPIAVIAESPTGTPTATPAPRAAATTARVSARAQRRGRRIVVTGTTPPAFRGRVSVTVIVRTARRKRRYTATATANLGRFRARIRLPKHRRIVRVVRTIAKTGRGGLALTPVR